MNIEDIVLICTCGACPEQYDAYYKDNKVAYLRLRHGFFHTSMPGTIPSGGNVVYSAETIGDGLFTESERDFHLNKAKEAIVEHLIAEGKS